MKKREPEVRTNDVWDRFAGLRYGNFFERKPGEGEWEDRTESKLTFKIYMVIVAIGLMIATVVNYNYLGGIEGILNAELIAEEGLKGYLAGVGCLVVLPLLAVFCLWLGFKKKRDY